ncbi:MAG TPA: alpha/beta hydrolase [Bryobacteraceae bacterium]|nr:alpha/beta hydrolase [Bryobacteraceae bacterium]
MKIVLALLFLCAASAWAAPAKPETILLWPNGAPGAVGTEDQDKPSVTIYRPEAEAAIATAVVVCPGGGYAGLAMDHEGAQIAHWLNSLGITAFVLKYRLGPRYHHPVEWHDAQRAVRYARSRAKDFGFSAHQLGIWGFSAGGHLASTVETHFDSGDASAADAIDRESSRPDFAILSYPVVTMKEPYVHHGSREHLLGDQPSQALIDLLSNETQVTPQTPPTFLFHTTTDNVVPVENSVQFYLALRKNNVPAELHVFEKGPHGVGLAATDATLSVWPSLLANWLRTRGLLDHEAR